MSNHDPIERVEKMVRDMHDRAGNYTQPVLRRYPLLFAFLLVFSVAAILHGFEIWADQIQMFHDHPTVLMLIGAVLLLATGTLYKALKKMG
jgi:hypothetical protein